MSDWREMEAGEALDRLIAERLGRDVHTSADFDKEDVFGGQVFCADREWHEAWIYELGDDRYPRFLPIPEYSTDLNGAWSLLSGLPFDVGSGPRMRWGDLGAYRCQIQHKPGFPVGYADTPALAICRAWLAYDDAKAQVTP